MMIPRRCRRRQHRRRRHHHLIILQQWQLPHPLRRGGGLHR